MFGPGIFLHTCIPLAGKTVLVVAAHHRNREIVLENMFCLRCNRELGIAHKSVAIYFVCADCWNQAAQEILGPAYMFFSAMFCFAMGPPPEGALNLAAWEMIRDLVGSDPALNQAAWENLTSVLGSLPLTGTAGARLSATSGGYFEF
jgi:hypothetical protein